MYVYIFFPLVSWISCLSVIKLKLDHVKKIPEYQVLFIHITVLIEVFLVFPSVPENEDMNAGGERDECMEKRKRNPSSISVLT